MSILRNFLLAALAGLTILGSTPHLAAPRDALATDLVAVETHGVISGTWQNQVGDPQFVIASPDQTNAGIAGYKLYWGNEPDGTSSDYFQDHLPSTFKPATTGEGIFFLRVQTRTQDGVLSPWKTVFEFLYDHTPPTALTDVAEQHGSQNGICENVTNQPVFSWSGATDALSGIDYYEFAFGFDRDAVKRTGWTRQPTFSPGRIIYGAYYLSIRTVDKAGNRTDWVPYFYLIYDRCFRPNRTPYVYNFIVISILVGLVAIFPNFLKRKKKTSNDP